MSSPSVLISGASIAGPALAYWLDRYGYDVTVVEKASRVRPGGQAVDFKGDTHRTVLTRMGILDDVLRARVDAGDGIIVDAVGHKIGVVPGEFSGGEINIPRGDLPGCCTSARRPRASTASATRSARSPRPPTASR